jgi:hypothetical protein
MYPGRTDMLCPTAVGRFGPNSDIPTEPLIASSSQAVTRFVSRQSRWQL